MPHGVPRITRWDKKRQSAHRDSVIAGDYFLGFADFCCCTFCFSLRGTGPSVPVISPLPQCSNDQVSGRANRKTPDSCTVTFFFFLHLPPPYPCGQNSAEFPLDAGTTAYYSPGVPVYGFNCFRFPAVGCFIWAGSCFNVALRVWGASYFFVLPWRWLRAAALFSRRA